jgi:hypothetical protein
MSTITTRCDGHLITATRINDTWEVQIDSHLPLMERDFYMRSTYCSADPGIAIRSNPWIR